MQRGDVVTVAAGGGFGGKPRPALVVQADDFSDLTTVVVALFTTTASDAALVRQRFLPDAVNGLNAPSELMTDILVTVRREQVGTVIGHLTAADLRRAERALLTLLGFGG